MHGGRLKPSMHHFSIRDLAQRKRRNKGQREFVHQVGAGPRGKIARDLVQRKRRTKVQGNFVHQVGAGPGVKIARDLVQRKRKNKVQRVFVHQVPIAPGRRPVTSPKAPPPPAGGWPLPHHRTHAYSRLNR